MNDAETNRAVKAGDDEATTLVAILSQHYNAKAPDDRFDFADADPLSLEHELRREFGSASARTLTKINAALALLMRPQLFSSSLGFFTAICAGLNGLVCGSPEAPGSIRQTMMLPDSDDILWAVTEASLLLGDRYDEQFSPNIKRWVGMTLADEGFRMAPEMLHWADYGKDDESRALSRSSADRAFGNAAAKMALENCDALELGIATRLGEMLGRWNGLGLAKEGDSWFDSLSEGVSEELERISSRVSHESNEA